MFNVFEQPWTLVGAAVLVLFGVFTFRSIFPEKRHRWQWLLPAFLTITAFGADLLVLTDLEKINAVIRTGIRAVQEEDCSAIEGIIADDYWDSYHETKEGLMAHCRSELSKPLVQKNKKTGLLIRISGADATATLFTLTTFEKDSYISQTYKPFFQIKVELHLEKQPDKSWLVNHVKVLEIDRNRVTWSDIR